MRRKTRNAIGTKCSEPMPVQVLCSFSLSIFCIRSALTRQFINCQITNATLELSQSINFKSCSLSCKIHTHERSAILIRTAIASSTNCVRKEEAKTSYCCAEGEENTKILLQNSQIDFIHKTSAFFFNSVLQRVDFLRTYAQTIYQEKLIVCSTSPFFWCATGRRERKKSTSCLFVCCVCFFFLCLSLQMPI